MSPESPVGVFDSGVGGLSILRAVRAILPAEHLVYLADAGHLPYGEKPESEIRARSRAVTEFLLSQGAKAVLVACNTATAAAIEDLRQRFAVPFIGVEPAVKPAARLTQSGVIGLLVTGSMGTSARLDQLLQRHGSQVHIVVQPCPGLVEQVEREAFEDEATLALLHRYISPLLERGVDTLILGCTHYVFLESAIRRIAGPQVRLLETGAPVAQELARRLDAQGLLRKGPAGTEVFWTTGSADHFTRLLRRVWPRPALARSWHQPVSA